MNVEDLLLSTQSLMRLQEAQVKSEGREFSAMDAMLAARPALESVLSEVLDLQRGKGGPEKCPHCHGALQLTIDDVYDDYDNAEYDDIIDTIEDGSWSAEELRTVHEHEVANQKRGGILSKITTAFSAVAAGESLTDDVKKEREAETGRVLDKMFDDIFKGQSA